MSKNPKTFQFLDIVKFARPSILAIDPNLTAAEIVNRTGKGYLSYSSIYPRISEIVSYGVDKNYLDLNFSFYKQQWKNGCVKEVATLIAQYFSCRGNWYPAGGRKFSILGTLFRPAKTGSWFVDGKSYDVLINPRKEQPLSGDDKRFLARAMYEMHGIDDPNNPDQIIIDISSPVKKSARMTRASHFTPDMTINLDEFEEICRVFFDALAISGISEKIPDHTTFTEISRKYR